MDRIFINMHKGADWILRFLAEDIQREAKALGYECRIGDFPDYDGEEIYFDYMYHAAVPMKRAKHNSVFYTHLLFKLQEDYLVSIKDKFDSYICMSPEDAEYLIELGFDKDKVFGHNLPIRNSYIKPLVMGIFSSCYADNRKNELWLIDYCKTHKQAQLANFVFIGRDWGDVVNQLQECGCSSTWVNITRNLPYEYQYQQNMLQGLDYYLYMGMDGGAMGTYDAYAQGVPLCVTFDGFHKNIPSLDLSFDNQDSFINCMNKIFQKQENRLNFFKNSSSKIYFEWLDAIWKGKKVMELSEQDKKCISYESVLEKKRDQYMPLTFNRLKMLIRWKLGRIKNDKRYNN